jgi:Fe-S-cluster containining protein
MSTEEVRRHLPRLYEDVACDIAAAAPVCEVSGRCCRFKEFGHTLFLSRPEAEELLAKGLPEGAVITEEACPFQINGLCTAREHRPLACRIFFCDPNYAETSVQLSERYIARLKQLHNATETEWEYRRLHEFLREALPSAPE